VIDNESALLDILDTAGQEEYSAMREQYMRSGEGFVLVYAINSRPSFEEIQTFYQQILRVKDCDYIPMTLVGNKCDLDNEREISTNEGKEMARKMNAKFVESSARYRINVDEAYYSLVRSIRDENRKIRGSTKNLNSSKDQLKKKRKCLIM
jgi:GTPase KRas protein